MQVKDLQAVPEQSAGVAGQIRPERRLETEKHHHSPGCPFAGSEAARTES
jgi:hypothetical protein